MNLVFGISRRIVLAGFLLNSTALLAEEAWKIALRDSSGRAFELSSDSGRPLLLSFFFTTCPTACPMQTAKLANLHHTLSSDLKAKVSFVSISIDPERDSPDTAKEFARRMAVDTKDWRWTVPERRAELEALLKNLGIPVTVDPKTKNIDHKMTIVLLDGEGHVRQRYQGTMFSHESVKNDLEALIRLQTKKTGKPQG